MANFGESTISLDTSSTALDVAGGQAFEVCRNYHMKDKNMESEGPTVGQEQVPVPNPLLHSAVDPIPDKDQRSKVEFMAELILQEEKADAHEKAVSGKAIFVKANEKFPNAGVPKNTFLQYLSKAVRDPNSRINCLGKKQGYFLSESGAITEAHSESGPADEKQATNDDGRREKEKRLYDVLLNWLIEQEYRSKVTASTRGNGQWGNPDISGIACDESFGSLWLEVATIEVKLSERDWKKWIFEAVSHRRFANRSYFAFAHRAEVIKKLDSELRYFSELYQVGILVVAMESQQYDDLQSGALEKPVDDEDVDIIELYSAPYTAVQPRYQKEFLKTLKITSTPDVARWGRGLDDNYGLSGSCE